MEDLPDDLIVSVMLRDPTNEDENGTLVVPSDAFTWHQVPWHNDPTKCEHDIMACPHCLSSWYLDHDVRFQSESRGWDLTGDAVVRELRPDQCPAAKAKECTHPHLHDGHCRVMECDNYIARCVNHWHS